MKTSADDYIDNLNNISKSILTDVTLNYSMEKAINIIKTQSKNNKKVIIIGNGGSSSIANHLALDLWKNAGIKSLSFSDSSLITCVSNDFGYENVFLKPIKMFAEKGDILIAISSSGESLNILNAINIAKEIGCTTITMSGFNKTNSLRTSGDINFYVPSSHYGYIELAHSVLCHYISDILKE